MSRKAGAKYSFRAGSRVGKVSAEAAAKEFERLRKKEGVLKPEDVVASAEPEDSPLHDAFEWDDSEAGVQYRLIQARQLIRALVVVVDDEPSEPCYVHVRMEEQRGYHPVEVVVKDHDMLAAAIEELNEHLVSIQKTINDLRSLAKQAGRRKAVRQIDTVGKHLEAAVSAAAKVK